MSIEELYSQEEIDSLREYWLKEKTETNSVISIVCLGILRDVEKIIKQATVIKESQTLVEQGP